eukprot:g3800.t1
MSEEGLGGKASKTEHADNPKEQTKKTHPSKRCKGILILRCSPHGKSALAATKEEIEDIRKRYGEKARTFESGDARTLLDHLDEDMTELHIASHMDDRTLGDETILFVDDYGNTSIVPANEIVELIAMRKDTLELVVLNGCCSEKMAAALARKGVRCVVGWKTTVDDDAAKLFADGWHAAWIRGDTPSVAFERAKKSVTTTTFDPPLDLKGKKINQYILMDPDSSKIKKRDPKHGWILEPKTLELLCRTPAGVPVMFQARYGFEILCESARREDKILPLHPGTRAKPQETLCEWSTGKGKGGDRPLFWIQGAHGVGKSALVKAAVTTLRKVSPGVATFFAKAKDPRLSRVRNAIHCWSVALGLLVENDEDVDLEDAAWKKADAFEVLLRTYVFDPLAKREKHVSKRTVLVLDALDECDGDDDGARFVETTAELVVEYREKKDVDVRLLVSSTTKPAGKSRFRKKKLAGTMQLGSKKDPSLDADIEHFSRDKIGDAVKDRFATDDLGDVAKIVRKRSQKCFLYARFATRLVCDAIEGGEIASNDKLRRVVHAFPPGLSALLFDYATRPFEKEEKGDAEAKLRNQLREALFAAFLAVGETCPVWLARRVLENEAMERKVTKMSDSEVHAVARQAEASMASLVKASKGIFRMDAVIHDWILLDQERYELGQVVRNALESTSSGALSTKVCDTDEEDEDVYGFSDDDEEEDAISTFAVPVGFESRPGARRVQYLRENPQKAGSAVVDAIVTLAEGDSETYGKVVRMILGGESRGRAMMDVAAAVRMTRRVKEAPVAVMQELLRFVQKAWGTTAREKVSVGEAAAVCLDGILRSGGTPTVVDFSIVVSAWCETKNMQEATRVLDSMLKVGVKPNEVTFNTLIRGWCEMKKMQEATRVLDSMLKVGV